MKRLLLVIAVSFIATTSAAGEPWNLEPKDFRGVPFGSTLAEAKAILGRYNSHPPACSPTGCFQRFYVGDVETSQWFTFRDEKLVSVRITFPVDAYEMLRGVFVERYGQPAAVRSETARNLLGAVLEGERLTWAGVDVSIDVRQYSADSLREGEAIVYDRRWAAELRNDADDARKKAAAAF